MVVEHLLLLLSFELFRDGRLEMVLQLLLDGAVVGLVGLLLRVNVVVVGGGSEVMLLLLNVERVEIVDAG